MAKVKRTNRTISLTESEVLRLRQFSSKCGMTQAGYMRSLLNGYKPKEKPPAEFYNALKQLYELLYQIEDKGISPNLSEKVYDLIYEIEKKYIKPDKS